MDTRLNRTMGRGLLLLAIASACAAATEYGLKPEPAANKHDMKGMTHAAGAMSDAEMIKSAISAAPMAVAKDATVVVAGADSTMRTLRAGKNGFTCMPDNPATPGPDPMCWDRNAQTWMDAYMGHKPVPAGHVGFMYMLAGGTDASNTDPYAQKPTTSNHWIKTGAHIMIVGADAAFYDNYPKSADPDTSQPYVMWAGTPYQHLMAPVK